MIILVDEINRSRCRCYFTTRNFFESVFRRVVTFTQGKQKIKIIKILSHLLISPCLSQVISSIESRKHGPNRKTYNRPWFQSRLKVFFFWFKEGTGAQKKKKKKKERARFGIEWNDCCFNGVIYGIYTHTPTPFVHISIRSGIDDRPLYRRDTRGTVVTRKRIRVYGSPNTDVRIFLDCISRNTSYTHRQYRADLLRHENLC